jgi:ABC-2 type transport system permease protein
MPIHDQGYQRYAGHRIGPGRAWQVIARAGIQTFAARRAFLGLLLLSWTPFLAGAVQVYLSSSFAQAAFLAPNNRTYWDFLQRQGSFAFLITVWVGAGLIADDRRAHALSLYLSKPLTIVDYVVGKLAILLLLLAGVIWAPAMALLLVQSAFAGSFEFVRTHLSLVPAITAYSLTTMALSSLTMLALSSLSSSSRFVGIMYAGVIFFTQAITRVLSSATGMPVWNQLSPLGALDRVGQAIFGLDGAGQPGLWPALGLLVALLVASVLTLRWRVRGMEVVS